MIKPKASRTIPQCSSCRFYQWNPFVICDLFPQGPEGDFCPYHAPDPDLEPDPQPE